MIDVRGMDPSSFEISRREEIEQVSFGKPHVFILGAGASIAAVPHGDRHGQLLPDMRGLSQLPEVQGLLSEAGIDQPVDDFEATYAELRADPEKTGIGGRIDDAVREYFGRIEIPPAPTIYDHLILSLRDKDLIASFNWDPLLMQAYLRLHDLGVENRPRLAFLHGNVALGVCLEDRVSGVAGAVCSKCRAPLEQAPLLYPVAEKNYEAHDLIANEWKILKHALENAALVTIFGYRAPKSDVAAIARFKDAWGDWRERNMEQFELIGRPGADPEKLEETWEDFIHTHHFEVVHDFFDSFVALHPRRSGEAYWNQYWEAKFINQNPAPRDRDLAGTVNWYGELMSYEGPDASP
jgi:hypothetical protein